MQLFVLPLLHVFSHLIMNKCVLKSGNVSPVINLRTSSTMISLHRDSSLGSCEMCERHCSDFILQLPKYCWEILCFVFFLKKKKNDTNVSSVCIISGQMSYFNLFWWNRFATVIETDEWSTFLWFSFTFALICAGKCDQASGGHYQADQESDFLLIKLESPECWRAPPAGGGGEPVNHFHSSSGWCLHLKAPLLQS